MQTDEVDFEDAGQENWPRVYAILLVCHVLVILLFIWFTSYFS